MTGTGRIDDDLIRRALAARDRARCHPVPPMTMTPAQMRAKAEQRWSYRLWWRHVNRLHRLRRKLLRR
ncbi:hypothetical protein [Catelliglobosispora koreensis]|uniref:hypothetical protein n=1 Tax=Catelliglobosispora koreensis TaxID=129052 RepID=UPI00036EAEF7|nr:hypothetical protein [Catelliglobosispora koreensis]